MRLCPECKNRTESRACEKCGTPTLLESALGGASQKPDPLIGQVFDDRYTVVDRIGKGGMGSVYKARQLTMGRDVALKVLNPDLMEDADSAGRFVREAKVASRLRHPNTIVVYDFGHAPQGLYIAMELLEGETLYHRLRRQKRLDVPSAARIGAAIASSLDEAHAQGIVHRDLKPANIFLASVHGGAEVVKVLDFGVARFFQDQATRSKDSLFETNRPMMVGTLQYMAPEQIRGQGVDARADLYALGIMLYEMVAGVRPLDGDSPVNTMQRQLEDVAPRLEGDVVPAYADLVQRLLAKSPDARPASAAEVSNALFALSGISQSELPVARASSRLVRPDLPPPARPDPAPAVATPVARPVESWDAVGEGDALPATEAVSSQRIARPLPYGARGEHLRGGLRADGGGAVTELRDAHAVERHVGIAAGHKRSSWPMALLAVLAIAAVVGGVWFALTRNTRASDAPTTPQVVLTSEPSGATVNDAATGKALGRTPLTLSAEAGAPTKVLLGLDGYRASAVTLDFPERGGVRRLPVTLDRLPTVSLESEPPGATVVWVDRNQPIPGRTPLGWLVPDEALAQPGGVEIRFELDGYEPRPERIKAKDLAEGRGVPPVRLVPIAAAPAPARGPEAHPRRGGR